MSNEQATERPQVRKYFGTDGIRGRANGVITPELAMRVGQAAGIVFQRGDYRHRVVIGRTRGFPAT
jgi:phosphoglucosamine mutase